MPVPCAAGGRLFEGGIIPGNAHKHGNFLNFLMIFDVQAQLWFFAKPDKTKESVNIIGNDYDNETDADTVNEGID
jgi:hypothetical protein